jgi:hypothetical protein
LDRLRLRRILVEIGELDLAAQGDEGEDIGAFERRGEKVAFQQRRPSPRPSRDREP